MVLQWEAVLGHLKIKKIILQSTNFDKKPKKTQTQNGDSSVGLGFWKVEAPWI